MELNEKAYILTDFTIEFSNDESYQEFFDYNDLGIPIAVALANDLVILTQAGEDLLNETWRYLCELFSKNHEDYFESLDDILEL